MEAAVIRFLPAATLLPRKFSFGRRRNDIKWEFYHHFAAVDLLSRPKADDMATPGGPDRLAEEQRKGGRGTEGMGRDR